MCDAITMAKWMCLVLIVLGQVVAGTAQERREAKQGNKGNKGTRCPNSSDFVCKNGQCIPEGKECDGIVDCEDESDEGNSCHRVKCPTYLFRCKYGACIDADKECDGKPDCRDRSDETSPKCSNITAIDSCREDQFRCSSGQCINQNLKCDGKADCRDYSDEIAATCWNIRCPGFTYRCDYGACVDGNAKCNGRAECFDGSDEEHCKERPKCTLPETPLRGTWTVVGSTTGNHQPEGLVDDGTILTVSCDTGYTLRGSELLVCTNGTWSAEVGTCIVPTETSTPPVIIDKESCILPDFPRNGSWSVYKSPTKYQPGERIGDGQILQISCKRDFKLDGPTSISCMNGAWSSPVGECKRICPPRKSSPKLTVTCTFEGRTLKDCLYPFDGTLAKYKCAPFYATSSNQVQVCNDGSWNLEEPQCSPVCGMKSVSAQTLIVNGTSAPKGDYPWQVALYTDGGKKFICGGSMVTQRIIVSAAHCVTDPNDGRRYPKENYLVAVGKYYRNLDDQRDKLYVQQSKLEHIFVPKAYQGQIQNYLADIAVLVTEKTFKLSLKVQPVCIDTGIYYNIPHGVVGYVPGWGLTSRTGDTTDELKEIQVPVVKDEECAENLDEDYFKFRTYDKMCAGFLDKAKGVCQGDSGGGLVIRFDGRYFLTGIVSLSPQSQEDGGGCDVNEYALYTRVSQYIDYIIGISGRFLPDENV